MLCRSKERVFRNLVNEPADHYIDLFWARLLPYLATVATNETIEYRLLLRNNFPERTAYGARLLPPQGWKTSSEFAQLELEPGDRGELSLAITAPPTADNQRRLMRAEITINGKSQGQIRDRKSVV